IDSLLDEFAGELTLLKSIPPGVDKTDCHPGNEIRLSQRLLYDNSSPRPPEEFNSENSNAEIESFSPSPIPDEDSDSSMEEIDLFLTPYDLMLPSIKDDKDFEGDILFERLLHDDPIPLPDTLDFSYEAKNDPTMSNEFERYVNSDFVTHLHPKVFATFDVLGFLKEKETMFPVLSRMAMDLISVQASSVASESVFSTSERVLSIQRTRLTPASLEMRVCLKDHLDAKERKQDKCPLEIPLDFEEDVFYDDVQRNEAIPLSDEEIALDASSEGTLSPGGPRYYYMMSSEAEDDY
nr:zinc finger BED domain-containing protein RICESLEEPER 2 [Tanacetum cinerariifolium]